jgi:hypothetical protein
MTLTVNFDTPPPYGNWIKAFGKCELAGSHFVADYVNGFIQATSDLAVGVPEVQAIVIREPTNKFDLNAIKIEGAWKTERWPLGYLPRDLARQVAFKYSTTMPIGCSLIWIRFVTGYIYVKVQLYVPNAQMRKENNWNRV